MPAVLKTASWGYDGKGQVRVESHQQACQAWQSLGGGEAVLERWIDFASELSVVAVRGLRGDLACFDPITNIHRHHILDVSLSPADVSSPVASAAVEIARAVMTRLEVVGVLCVEFFVTKHGDLLINELAPRPHNSGSSDDRCPRGLPIRATGPRGLRFAVGFDRATAARRDGQPLGRSMGRWGAVLVAGLRSARCQTAPVWQTRARPGRKMGHVTALASSTAAAGARVLEAREH